MIGASSSFMFNDAEDLSKDAEQILNDVIDEITTYLRIDDAIGKYYTTNGVRRIERIVIQVKQFIQNNINISDITIKISNKDDMALLKYSGLAVEGNSGTIFDHEVWDQTTNSFSIITILDTDRSILDYGVMNEDIVFFAIKLPDRFCIDKNEAIMVSIVPSKGTITSVVLEAPSVHISNVLSFKSV